MELFAYIMLIVMSIVCSLLLWLLNSTTRDLKESLDLNEQLLKENKLLKELFIKKIK